MKIVFMGTPQFAVPSLEKILSSGYEVAAVVTAPDKERGRGREVSYTPVKKFALERNLKVFTPVKLADPVFIDEMKKLSPDLFVVVAFRILPKEVFTIPALGSFNLHGSLLPKYRGAAPIQWALINGETETGVTTFFLDEKVDTGNIILQVKLKIDPQDDFGSLHDKMMKLGADVVVKTISLIETKNYNLSRQDDSAATAAPKIAKEICCINWSRPAVEIHNLVRGLSPSPGAFFVLDGRYYKIYKTSVIAKQESTVNGILAGPFLQELTKNRIEQTKHEIFVKTSNGILQILEIQPEGRKRMTAKEFLRGYSLI